MDRKQLVRAYFDAYRDLTWAEGLEPNFRENGVEGAALAGYREAWNRHTEKRDWAWWQEQSERMSDSELQAEIAECAERLGQLGMGRCPQEQRKNAQEAFGQLLKEAAGAEDRPRETPNIERSGREK